MQDKKNHLGPFISASTPTLLSPFCQLLFKSLTRSAFSYSKTLGARFRIAIFSRTVLVKIVLAPCFLITSLGLQNKLRYYFLTTLLELAKVL